MKQIKGESLILRLNNLHQDLSQSLKFRFFQQKNVNVKLVFLKHVGKIANYFSDFFLLHLPNKTDFLLYQIWMPNFTSFFILIFLPMRENLLITDILSIR